MPNVLSPRDLVFRPDNMEETVPHTPQLNLVAIDPLVSEIFMFESVNTHTDGRTDGRTPVRPVYYKLTSEPSAQVSSKPN